jgi:predicted RNA-binding protein with PIN domain
MQCHLQMVSFEKHVVKGDTQQARQLLTDDLENLRSVKGWRIEVAFDDTRRSLYGPLGHGAVSTTKSMAQNSQKDVSKHNVRVVYTGVGIEADSYIEARCASAKNTTNGQVTG